MKSACIESESVSESSGFDSVSPSAGGELGESGGKIETRGVRKGSLGPMPSVGMRRTTRVFGLVKKSVDGARVLRSGRRLWPESGESKLRRGSDGDEWFKLIDNSGGGDDGGVRNCKENGWHEPGSEQQVAAMEIDGELAVPHSGKTVPRGVPAKNAGNVDRKFGLVYGRKRKRLDVGSSKNKRGLEDRMYGIQFVRRKRSRGRPVVVDATCVLEPGFVGRDVSHGGGMLGVVVESSCSRSCLFSRFLIAVLGYMKRARLRLRELSAFIFSEPITSVFSLHGIHFLRDPACSNSFPICKIFGARLLTPLFSVDFSALPFCFMYIHSSMLLRSERLLSVIVIHSMGMHTEAETITDSKEHLSCIPSKREDLSDSKHVAFGDDNPSKRRVSHQTVGGPKFPRRNAQSRNGLNSRSIRGKRRSLRSRRARNPSLVGVHKANNGTLVSDFFSIRNNVSPFSSAVSNHKRRRSVWSSPPRNIREMKSNTVGLKEDIDSTCCSANILVIESDKCYREEGAKIMLEISPSNQWFLVVKTEGATRYSHKAEKVMRPCATNRFTHAIIWTVEDGWKLEFPNRQDWLIFKELYKECSERNVPDPTVKNIPVPGVCEVSGYGDTNITPFLRPDSYITLNDDEVSRALAKRTSNYDMDSEDEVWLNEFNNEFSVENELNGHVSEENFELMVDAFEKASYCCPNDYSNEKDAANLCPDLGRREVVEAVYSYWLKKRKQKHLALVKVFQCHQPRRAQLITDPVLRKKRSFKRQASQPGRGKQRVVIQVVAAEQDASDELSAMLKVEEAKATAKKSVELSVCKRQRAQFLMANADLATYKAAMALRIAEASRVSESLDAATESFLDDKV